MGLEVERHEDILLLRFARPEALNALDLATMRQLHDELCRFRDDPALIVAILTGSGERAFCVGADLKQTPPPQTSYPAAYFAPYAESVEQGNYIRAITINELGINKPLLAAVNGHAVGGGLELALSCDLRIASPNATFGLPEPRWATVPGVGGASLLLRSVPPAVAMRMLLTGESIDAEEAYRVGLISDLVPAEELLDHAFAIARRIATNGPLAVQSVKTLAMRSAEMPLSQSIALEQLLWGLLRDTSDRVEGRRAYAERRPPKYSGH